MIEKDCGNTFRFLLTQGNDLLCETMFDADKFNPFTRYMIDVRDILPRIITRLQKTLSKKSYDVELDVGLNSDGEIVEYNFYDYHQKMINLYPKQWRSEMSYNPKTEVQKIEYKTIRGVPCKISLHINDNLIVEREFFVDRFNPVSKQSLDVLDVVTEITEMIERKIKVNDVKNMWDDYDLINIMGFTINQIRELHPARRIDLLRNLKRN